MWEEKNLDKTSVNKITLNNLILVIFIQQNGILSFHSNRFCLSFEYIDELSLVTFKEENKISNPSRSK